MNLSSTHATMRIQDVYDALVSKLDLTRRRVTTPQGGIQIDLDTLKNAEPRPGALVSIERGWETWLLTGLAEAGYITVYAKERDARESQRRNPGAGHDRGTLQVLLDTASEDGTDTGWYPRERRTESDFGLDGSVPTIDAERLTLAWALHTWNGEASGTTPVWRHVLECTGITGSLDLGEASGGGCETCYYEYTALTFRIACECGLINTGNTKSALELSNPTHADGREVTSLADLVSEVEDLRDLYLATDETHWPWFPSLSRGRSGAPLPGTRLR